MKLAALALCVVTLGLSTPGLALDAAQVANPKKQTTLKLYATPQEVAEMRQKDPSLVFVDIRTPEETAFVGMTPLVDANIPYKVFPSLDDVQFDDEKKTFKLAASSAFSQEIDQLVAAKGGNKDSVIVLMCRSGDRSAAAADLLAKVGYTHVYSAVEGFEGDLNKKTGHRDMNGWKNAGLPWSYDLDKGKAYHSN